jgi:hypothetical protein
MDDSKKSEFNYQIRKDEGGKDEDSLSAEEVADILRGRIPGQKPGAGSAAEEEGLTDLLGGGPQAKTEKTPDGKTSDEELSGKPEGESPLQQETEPGEKPAEPAAESSKSANKQNAEGVPESPEEEETEDSVEHRRFHMPEINLGGLRSRLSGFFSALGSARHSGEESGGEDDGSEEESRRGETGSDEDEEEERPIRKLSEGTLRILTWVIVAAAVIGGAFLIRLAVKKWNYRSLEVTADQTVDNPVSSSYIRFGTGVLRYSADSATYIDGDHKSRWETTYSMDSPKVDISGDCAVIYDAQGSDLVVCDTGGETNRITAELPVSRAAVSERGTVAALMSDSSGTLIRYYSSEGSEISTIRTSMSDPGYPMSFAISDDGTLLAVSYLTLTDGTLQSGVSIYSFASEGQAKVDNIVGSFSFSGELIPEIRYLSGDTLAVFRDDGFTVIDGGAVPKIRSEVKTDSTIESLFYNDRYVGYVLENDSDTEPFILNVFDLDGREMTRTAFSFTFETVEFSGTQISLYNRDKLCVYGVDGEKKFEGSCGESPDQFLATGTKQYVISDESGIKWLRLH